MLGSRERAVVEIPMSLARKGGRSSILSDLTASFDSLLQYVPHQAGPLGPARVAVMTEQGLICDPAKYSLTNSDK